MEGQDQTTKAKHITMPSQTEGEGKKTWLIKGKKAAHQRNKYDSKGHFCSRISLHYLDQASFLGKNHERIICSAEPPQFLNLETSIPNVKQSSLSPAFTYSLTVNICPACLYQLPLWGKIGKRIGTWTQTWGEHWGEVKVMSSMLINRPMASQWQGKSLTLDHEQIRRRSRPKILILTFPLVPRVIIEIRSWPRQNERHRMTQMVSLPPGV